MKNFGGYLSSTNIFRSSRPIRVPSTLAKLAANQRFLTTSITNFDSDSVRREFRDIIVLVESLVKFRESTTGFVEAREKGRKKGGKNEDRNKMERTNASLVTP